MIDIVPTDLTVQWRELLARHARTTVALDEALDEFGLGMSEFEVLDRLACECGERPRMQDLAPMLHLSQSALSRTVGRLEKDGLVVRVDVPGGPARHLGLPDRRGPLTVGRGANRSTGACWPSTSTNGTRRGRKRP